jgi:hypothetical protein
LRGDVGAGHNAISSQQISIELGDEHSRVEYAGRLPNVKRITAKGDPSSSSLRCVPRWNDPADHPQDVWSNNDGAIIGRSSAGSIERISKLRATR